MSAKHMTIAKGYLGERELAGKANNNEKILAMYATVGHDSIEHDEVAWCAAFVGHCLEKSGVRSTRKLTARSYLNWGTKIDIKDAKLGDVVVFSRGSSSWEGHVAFFSKHLGANVQVLGGNQGNAVTYASYSRAKILGVRRIADGSTVYRPSVKQTQERLRQLGYHEVGEIDGEMGPRTISGILAFRADNGLPLTGEIDNVLRDALDIGRPRAISKNRSTGIPTESRIMSATSNSFWTSILGMFGAGSYAVSEVVGESEIVLDTGRRAFDLFGLGEKFTTILPWLALLVFGALAYFALRARFARIDDHQSGKTP